MSLVALLFTLTICYFLLKIIKKIDQIDLAKSSLGDDVKCIRFERVVVIGGSVAGLTAAGALAKHSKQVILLERQKHDDDFKSIAPQGGQAHVLLDRGLCIFERVFPGFENSLIANGAEKNDWSTNVLWYSNNLPRAKLEPREAKINMVNCSRILIEKTLRQRVTALPNVQTRFGFEVTGLEVSAQDPSQIVGVSSKTEKIFADLVVDCSGNATNAPQWFKAMGKSVDKSIVKSNVQYSTAIYKFEEEIPPFKGLYYQQSPPDKKCGLLIGYLGDGTWQIGAATINKVETPRDHQGFVEFTKEYDLPEAHRWVSKATPLGKPQIYKKLGTQYNHFEKLNVKGYIAIGDAVCSFNPVFGQGMSLACEGALIMDQLLRDENYQAEKFAQEFQKLLSWKTTLPWLLAATNDLGFAESTTNCNYLKIVRPLLDFLVTRTMIVGSYDKSTHLAFIKVVHMSQGYLWVLLSPKFLWRIITK